ncbi:MAG TPA: hypothetical protein VJN62_09190 [Gemmatimonadales bacterium]|nr:hypothetical protein [Gemmatimonadales bacterium]
MVTGFGFDSADFKWTEADTSEWSGYLTGPCLMHNPSDFYFALGIHSNSIRHSSYSPSHVGAYRVLLSPGYNRPVEFVDALFPFEPVLREVGRWLERIKEESAPDVWTQAAERRRLLQRVPAEETENARFNNAELKRLGEDLQEVLKAATELHVSAPEMKRLMEGIEYLNEAAARMGRKDWFMVASAVLMWAVPPEKAGQLLQTALHTLGWVIHLKLLGG